MSFPSMYYMLPSLNLGLWSVCSYGLSISFHGNARSLKHPLLTHLPYFLRLPRLPKGWFDDHEWYLFLIQQRRPPFPQEVIYRFSLHSLLWRCGCCWRGIWSSRWFICSPYCRCTKQHWPCWVWSFPDIWLGLPQHGEGYGNHLKGGRGCPFPPILTYQFN